MFTAIFVLACIGVLAIITFLVWWIGLSIARGRAIEELQIRINMKHDRIDYLSREIEDLQRNVSVLDDQQNAKAKPRKR